MSGLWFTVPVSSASALHNGSGNTSDYRRGCRCSECRAAHTRALAVARCREREEWWRERESELLADLAAGVAYDEAFHRWGVTWQGIHWRRKLNAVFAASLDAALFSGRDPALIHGKDRTYKKGCRCPECRLVHSMQAKKK